LTSIFVFGLFPEDSGKTVISTAIARGLLNEGSRVGVFKPRSGHNLWYQYESFLKCKSEGRLFCEDIMKLMEASRCYLSPEILNPIDALMSVFNVETFLKRRRVGQMYILESEVFSHLVVERYTILEDGEVRRILLINERNLKGDLTLLDSDYIERLEANSDQVIALKSLNEWSSLYRSLAPTSIRSCYDTLNKKFEDIVIEGYNDAIAPDFQLIRDVDIVVGVAPGVALFYDSGEFKKLIDTLRSLGRDPASLRAEDVVRYLKYYEVFKVPPIPRERLTDYDELCRRLKTIVDHVKSGLK